MDRCVLSTFDRSGVLRTIRSYLPVALLLLGLWVYIATQLIDDLSSGRGLPNTWVFGAIAIALAARWMLAAVFMLGGVMNPATPALYICGNRLVLMTPAFMSVPLDSIADVTTRAWKDGRWSGVDLELEIKGGKTRGIATAILSTDPDQLVEDIRGRIRL